MKIGLSILALLVLLACKTDHPGQSGDPGNSSEAAEVAGTPDSPEALAPAETPAPAPAAEPLPAVDPAKAFNQPWTDEARPIIIDPYRDNAIDWDLLQTDPRMVAIIHKASQGTRADSKYNERRQKARELGYLWGSYHLGMPGDPIQQAEFYLSIIGDFSGEVLALDLESLDESKFMSLNDAVKFIDHIRKKTGRYPLVYCNHQVLAAISEQFGKESIFAKCPLWYARFKKQISDFPKGTWETYTIWQFSCELNCEKTGECWYNVPGTAFDMDINVYNGSIAELKAKWANLGG